MGGIAVDRAGGKLRIAAEVAAEIGARVVAAQQHRTLGGGTHHHLPRDRLRRMLDEDGFGCHLVVLDLAAGEAALDRELEQVEVVAGERVRR